MESESMSLKCILKVKPFFIDLRTAAQSVFATELETKHVGFIFSSAADPGSQPLLFSTHYLSAL